MEKAREEPYFHAFIEKTTAYYVERMAKEGKAGEYRTPETKGMAIAPMFKNPWIKRFFMVSPPELDVIINIALQKAGNKNAIENPLTEENAKLSIKNIKERMTSIINSINLLKTHRGMSAKDLTGSIETAVLTIFRITKKIVDWGITLIILSLPLAFLGLLPPTISENIITMGFMMGYMVLIHNLSLMK